MLPRNYKANIYKCPYEGDNCKLHKHCHAIETPFTLPPGFKAIIECQERKAKIEVIPKLAT